MSEAIRRAVGPHRAVAWASHSIAAWMRERIVAARGDPSIVPEEPFRFLRLPEVVARTGLARSSIYRRIGEGTFPAPVILGSGVIAEGVEHAP
jgi:predicted DNA-binding transcriptional regulator AlpA